MKVCANGEFYIIKYKKKENINFNFIKVMIFFTSFHSFGSLLKYDGGLYPIVYCLKQWDYQNIILTVFGKWFPVLTSVLKVSVHIIIIMWNRNHMPSFFWHNNVMYLVLILVARWIFGLRFKLKIAFCMK